DAPAARRAGGGPRPGRLPRAVCRARRAHPRGGPDHPRRRAERQARARDRPLGLRARDRAHRRAGPRRRAARRRRRPQGLPGILRTPPMQLFLSQVINGVGNGVVFATVALALVLIFRTTRVLNFAQSEMALFSAYISWKLTTFDLPVWVAIGISMAIAFVAGAVIERTLIRPMEGRSPLNVVIITLGLFLGLNALVQLIFGTDPQTMPSPFPKGSVPFILDTRIQKDTIGLLLVLLAQCLGLWLLLNRTTIGLKLRAVAANPASALLHGIRAG